MIDRVNLTLTEGSLYYVGQSTILIDNKHMSAVQYQYSKVTSIVKYFRSYFMKINEKSFVCIDQYCKPTKMVK